MKKTKITKEFILDNKKEIFEALNEPDALGSKLTKNQKAIALKAIRTLGYKPNAEPASVWDTISKMFYMI